jgi:RNA-directed DNA polymerase
MSVSDSAVTASARRSRSILELTCDEARSFFLKQESYCTIDLPLYFHFNEILRDIGKVLEDKALSDLRSQSPRDFEKVNHLILNNKDGRHAWRPLQLIHPVLYVSLVNQITENDHWELICKRFAEFANNKKIKCLSLPVESLTSEVDKAEQITHWWREVEQVSVELALEYDLIIHTDITDCYGSIYTHSISWALHTKPEAKKMENRRNPNLLGNIIDTHIQDMCHGQTNGIPQGAVLMDFIAELVLGYADIELTEKIACLNIEDYCILRYRDDYRIFVNSSQDGERILKCLTEIMIDLGLKLNSAKTKISNQVISSSLKDDKRSWTSRKQADENLQKHLLIIHNHSIEHPNSGSVVVALDDYYKRVAVIESCYQALPLISITVDIAYRNPRAYAICAALLSKLISFLKTADEKRSVFQKAKRKFSQIPNTGHMQLWLQRISFPFDPAMDFDEPLCRLLCGANEEIWNNGWISSRDLRNAVDSKKIVAHQVLEKLDSIIPIDEVALFVAKAEYDS